jgi:sulfur-carrier protein
MKVEELMTVHVRYFALLREERGSGEETIRTAARNPLELYTELRRKHHLSLAPGVLRVAVNDEFSGWEVPMDHLDVVSFLPPVSGG